MARNAGQNAFIFCATDLYRVFFYAPAFFYFSFQLDHTVTAVVYSDAELFLAVIPRQFCGEIGILKVIKIQAADGVSIILKRVRISLAQKGQAFCYPCLLLVIDKVFQLITESQFFSLTKVNPKMFLNLTSLRAKL